MTFNLKEWIDKVTTSIKSINTSITSINTILSTQPVTFVATRSGGNSGSSMGVYFPTIKWAFISLSYNSASNVATGTTLYTIPTGYRPKSATVLPANVGHSNGVPYSLPGALSINTNGTITQNVTGYFRNCFAVGFYKVA